MKQTAVEWLFEQMLDDKLDRRYEILAEAKEMEKEQIMNAYKHELDDSLGANIIAEQYYNKTFKSE